MKQYVYISRREERPRPMRCCRCCGSVLFPGEVYYDLDGCVLCTACTELYVRRFLRPFRRQAEFAEVMP